MYKVEINLMYIYEDRIDFGTADHIFHLKIKYMFFIHSHKVNFVQYCIYTQAVYGKQSVYFKIGLLIIINIISSRCSKNVACDKMQKYTFILLPVHNKISLLSLLMTESKFDCIFFCSVTFIVK